MPVTFDPFLGQMRQKDVATKSSGDAAKFLNERGEFVAVSPQEGIGCVKGGYAVEVIGYEESGGECFLLLAPDDADLDMIKFAAGQTVTLSLVTEIEGAYTLTEAEIASVDAEGKKLRLSASLYQGDVTGAKQIGYEKIAVSGYTDSASGGPSAYRVTFSGGSNFKAGRKIYTRAGTGELVANRIAGTTGSYLYLSSAAAGTDAVYLGPSSVYVSNGIAEPDDDTLSCTGERNFVAGEASTVTGALNVVVGTGSDASGADNVVAGEFSVARGDGNRVAGNASYAVGVDNHITESMCFAVGNKNRIYAQGGLALGDGNTLTGINAAALGWTNRVRGFGAIAVGTANDISGQWSVAVGFNNEVASKSAYVIGRYANITDTIENKNGFFVHGGTKEKNGTALAVRTLKAVPNPAYVAGGDKPAYVEEGAFSTEYRGHLVSVQQTISAAGTVILDHDQYARWKLTGTGAVTLALANWLDGDRGEVVVDTSKQTITLPVAWIISGNFLTAWAASPGLYCMKIEQQCGVVYAFPAVASQTSTSGAGIPVGAVFPFVSSLPPTGAYLLNGQIIASCQTLYPAFWTWLAAEVSAGRVRTLASDAAFDAEVLAQGFCAAFVIDAAAGSVRLPKWIGYLPPPLALPVIGTGKTLGLTNGTGTGGLYGLSQSLTSDKASYGEAVGYTGSRTGMDGGNANLGITTDPDRSGLAADLSGLPSDAFHWVIQVYNATTSLSEQQAAQLAAAMQGKVDTTFGNAAGNLDFITAHWDDGDGNFYDIYRSGKIVQGGWIAGTGTSTSYQHTFPHAFADTTYLVFLTGGRNANSSDAWCYVYGRTTTGCTLVIPQTTGTEKHCYLAIGTAAPAEE